MAVLHGIQQHSTLALAERLQAQLTRSLEICELLEALADALPHRSVAMWRAAKQQCQTVLRDHVTLGTERIMPRLLRGPAPSPDHHNLLLRFQLEYGILADQIDDLDDLLFDAVATDRNRIGPEALGYALRNHFDALRKHIGWEHDVLLPMAARGLLAADP